MEVVPDRIRRDFPKGLCFGESKMIENLMGVWATTLISKGATFGPFQGEKKKLQDVEDDTYSWEIRGPKGRRLYCIDAADPSKGNWMRYVKSAHYYEEQNIIATQEKKSIYYKAMRDIPAGEELLCWFSTGYIPKVSQVKGETPCKDESADELPIQDSTKDPAPSGREVPCDDETSGNHTPVPDTPIPDTPTQGASAVDTLRQDTSVQDTSTEDTPTEDAAMSPLENGPLAIALGGFQISNVVSLASPESVITDDSSDLMECQNHMPILEKIQAEVSCSSDITAPISVRVSPRSKDTSPSNSPPLISPIYSTVLEDTGKRYNRKKKNAGVEHAENKGVTAVDKELQDPVASESSSGCAQPEENNVESLGDEKNDSNVAQFSVEPSVAPPSMKTSQEFVGSVRTPGCMLQDPRDLKKKIDYIATTKGKTNVLKCLTCLNVYRSVDDLKKHFVNHANLPRRRKRLRRNGRKIIVPGNTSLINGNVDRVIESDSNALETKVNDGQSCSAENGQNSLRETAPLNADTATKVQMQCDFCTRSLDNAVLLDDHVKAHLANLIPYQCKICQEEFPSLPGIHEHIISFHSPPEPRPSLPLGTDGTDVSVSAYQDSSPNSNPTFKKKRKMKRRFHTKSLVVQQQPQTAQDSVMSSSNTSLEIRIKRKRNPNKIHPCSLCEKMFASRTNVYRHKRIVHKILTMRMRRSKHSKSLGVRQLCGNTSETSDEQHASSKVKNDIRPVTSSSDIPSTEDTDVGKSSFISSPPTSPNTNIQSSKKVYMLGGRRVRPILPAPSSSLGDDYSASTMRNNPVSPTSNTYGRQRQLTSQPPSAHDSIVEQHKRHLLDMSRVKRPIVSSNRIQSNNPAFDFHNNTPPGVRPSIDVKGQPGLDVTRPGYTSRHQTQSGRYQGNNSHQISFISPQYANVPAADRVGQMVPLAQSLPSNASPPQSLSAGYPTHVKRKRKKQPVPLTQFTNPVNMLDSSARKPKPYVPMGDYMKRTCQHPLEGIYDQHGAMNLATKKEYVDPNDYETALDLTVHKRGFKVAKTEPLSNLELHQIPVQTVPLDLSMKSTPKPHPAFSGDSAIEKTNLNAGHLSTQLLRALEVVNAHAAMQVKTRNVDLEKLNIRHSHGSTETLIPRQSKTAIMYDGKVHCEESNPQDSYPPTLPNYESTVWPKNESQHSLLMSHPAMEKTDVKDVDLVRRNGAPVELDSVQTTMSIPSKSKAMKFDCNVCNVTFTSMKVMTAHVVEHADEWPYKCEFCVFLFKDPQDLWRHRSDLHRVQKMYACTLCQRDFVYFCNLKKHQLDIHGVKQCVYKELDQGQLRPQNFTDPTKAVSFQTQDSTSEEQHSRMSFLAQEMNKPNTLKIGRLTIKGPSPGVSPAKPNKPIRKQVPFNPQRHHPFARARQIGYLSMLADPKNHQTLSSALVNRCTKCEKEFEIMADFHQHILECAVQGAQTTQTGAQDAEKSLVPMSDIRNTSAPNTPNKAVTNVTSGKNKQKAPQQAGVSRLASSTPKRQRAKPGLKIYNPKKYSRREPAANMVDIHTCHGCGKKFYFINSLERHMRMCPNREKLKLNDITQVKQMTKKTDKTLLNSQHQCPFCKHHYTYLKSLKKHVLVCQFRPADIVDPLKIIEENFQRQQEEILRIKSQSDELIDVPNTKQRVQEIKQKTNASKVDNKIHKIIEEKQPKATMKIKKKKKKKKKSKVKVHEKRTKLPLDYSPNQEKIRSIECDGSPLALSSFSLKLKRVTEPSGIPVESNESEAGGLTNHEDARWCLAPDKANQGNDKTSHRDDPKNEVPPQLKKYPIRERSASVSTRYEDLSQFNHGVRYLRGQRSRGRGRARGRPLASSRGASFPNTSRARGGERRGRSQGRVRKRGGRGGRGKFASSRLGQISDDISVTKPPYSTTNAEESHETKRAHLRGRGRARCRGGSRRTRGMGTGGSRGKSTVSTLLQNKHADVAQPLPTRDEYAETASLPQVSLDPRENTSSEENQDNLEEGCGEISGKNDQENIEMDRVEGGNEDHATGSSEEAGEKPGLPFSNSPTQLADGKEHLATPLLPKPNTMDSTSDMDTTPLAGSDRELPDHLEH